MIWGEGKRVTIRLINKMKRLHSRICRFCALVASTSPLLTFADSDHRRNDSRFDHEERGGDGNDLIPVLPEKDAGSVFNPFVRAVLLFLHFRHKYTWFTCPFYHFRTLCPPLKPTLK